MSERLVRARDGLVFLISEGIAEALVKEGSVTPVDEAPAEPEPEEDKPRRTRRTSKE